MGGVFSSPSPPAPPPPAPPPPAVEDPAVQDAANAAAKQAKLKRGRAATVVTGGEGVTEAAPVKTKRLLGE